MCNAKLFMKCLPIIVVFFPYCAFAQKPDLAAIADSIKAEGKMLYNSEMASWYGSDILSEKFKDKQNMAGGYVSYDTGKGINNVFYTKGDHPEALLTLSFTYDPDIKNYKADTVKRKLSKTEKELYQLRQAAVADLQTDTLYKVFDKTSLNVIPAIYKNSKRVYILTAPQNNGVVLIGNDYLLTFDKNNKVVGRKKLHNTLIPFYTQNKDIQTAGIHTHLPSNGQFITATDICTIMLYGKFTTWNQHIVASKDYVSIWDCKKNDLLIITYDAWTKLNPLKSSLESSH